MEREEIKRGTAAKGEVLPLHWLSCTCLLSYLTLTHIPHMCARSWNSKISRLSRVSVVHVNCSYLQTMTGNRDYICWLAKT